MRAERAKLKSQRACVAAYTQDGGLGDLALGYYPSAAPETSPVKPDQTKSN
jgi:hypothetical protein